MMWLQKRVDCDTYFKENDSFYGCSLSKDGPVDYVLLASRRLPYLPKADYIGVSLTSRTWWHWFQLEVCCSRDHWLPGGPDPDNIMMALQ